MKTYLVPKFRLIIFVCIIPFLFENEYALAGTVPEVSGNFMLEKTPNKNEASNLLLVEKKDGLKSLIKIEGQTEGNITTPHYVDGLLEHGRIMF